MSEGSLVCAVDIGTSSIRAALVDPVGRNVNESRTDRRDAASQFDAEALWADVVVTLARLTSSSPALRPVALAIAGHVGSVVLDRHDHPLVPAGGWSDDRGVADVRALTAGLPAAWARSGRPAVTGGALALLRALSVGDPSTAEQVRTVLAPKDYVNLRLTGVHATDVTSAAYTLALDVGRVQWNDDLIAAVGLSREVFPDLAHGTGVIGAVSPAAAQLTGLPVGTPVAAGGPDGTVGAAAILGTDPGSIVDIAGTTDVLIRLSERPVDPAISRTVVNPYLVEGLWTHGGPTGMTGGAVTHCIDGFTRNGAEASALMAAALTAVPPGSRGLLAVPHLTGSRFPAWRDDERASLVGWDSSHRREDVVRAMHEGAAFAVREAVDVIDAGGSLPVVLAGGVAKSAALVQLRADVFGREVRTRTAPDASLLGAARLAQLAVGVHPTLSRASTVGELPTSVASPRPSQTLLYQEQYRRWRHVRGALLDASRR